jgi:hypothetical protein
VGHIVGPDHYNREVGSRKVVQGEVDLAVQVAALRPRAGDDGQSYPAIGD